MSLQLPAYLKPANPKFLSKMTAGLGGNTPPRVSIRNDRFTLMDANGQASGAIAPSLTLDVVVVGGNDHPSRIYYAGDYDPENTAAPDCFSDNGVGPSEQAASPQHEHCASCPQAVWGSGGISKMSGKKVPACSTVKKVAVVVMGDRSGTVYLLQIPPKSLKPWLGYMNHLGGQGIGPDQVITRLSIEDKTLGFAEVDFIPENYVAPIEEIMAGDDPDIVSGNRDKPILSGKALAAPVQRDVMQLDAPKPAPVEAPKRTRRPAVRENETVVEAGPIPAQTFIQPEQTELEKLRAQIAALESAAAPKAAGVMPSAPPPDSAVKAMLDKAFLLPTK